MQVKGLHIDDAESEDGASVVDNGGASEEYADVDDGGVDADLCDSRPVRLVFLTAEIGTTRVYQLLDSNSSFTAPFFREKLRKSQTSA